MAEPRSVRVAVLGAAGMLGTKLAQRLTEQGAIGGAGIASLLLVDVAAAGSESMVADFADPATAAAVVAARPDIIFHLAAVVSGEAEADFDKGYRVNLDATGQLLDTIRLAGGGYRPRLVFASSIAVFGTPFPDPIGDDHHLTPHTSYGTQKAIAELLLSDYSRRGFLDGIALRLPTICVRPGSPNLAASGFFSNIIREPLRGLDAVLPVPETVRHWFASPRSAVGFLLHAAALPAVAIGPRRCLTMPGVSATVADELAALQRFGGDAALAHVHREPDAKIAAMVSGWPGRFDAGVAAALGFKAESTFDQIVAAHIEDELRPA